MKKVFIHTGRFIKEQIWMILFFSALIIGCWGSDNPVVHEYSRSSRAESEPSNQLVKKCGLVVSKAYNPAYTQPVFVKNIGLFIHHPETWSVTVKTPDTGKDSVLYLFAIHQNQFNSFYTGMSLCPDDYSKEDSSFHIHN